MNIIPLLAIGSIAAAIIFLWLPPRPAVGIFAPESVTGRVRYIVDGDSLYIHSHRPQVRLWGVNTPEEGEVGYQSAKDHLRRLAQGKRITCQVMHRDKYGRTVGRCYLPDGRDIGAAMISDGMAVEMRGFSKGYYSRSR